jgi:hypothetical protein
MEFAESDGVDRLVKENTTARHETCVWQARTLN